MEVLASSRVGSTTNIKHQAGGGEVRIHDSRVEYRVGSRVDSMANIKVTILPLLLLLLLLLLMALPLPLLLSLLLLLVLLLLIPLSLLLLPFSRQ